MILIELSAYIIANATGFVAGPSTGQVQLWLNRFPDQGANTAVALYESGGVAPNYTYSGVDHERPGLQVLSRSTSYDTARSNAQRVWNLLAAVTNATISGTSYSSMTPVQSPFDIGTDAAGRSMLSANFGTDKAVS